MGQFSMYPYCPNMRLIMISEWPTNKRYIDMMHVRCKQWSCPYCARVNAHIWKIYLLNKLTGHDFGNRNWAFITLTANENAHKQSPQATIKNLQKTWKRLYDRLRTYNGGAFDYIRIFERHTEGRFGGYHLHVIADLGDCYARKKAEFAVVKERERRTRAMGKKPRKRLKREVHPARWIKDANRAVGGGFMADFKPIGTGAKKPLLYVVKYATKQIDIKDFPKHVRRIQASRDIGSPKKKGVSKIRAWRPKSGIFREDFNTWQKIVDITLKREVTLEEDFNEGQLWYPPELS